MALRIVHEASTQRQHVRVRAPLAIRIGHREYTAYDWSVAGIGIKGLEPAPQIGHRIAMSLLFRFDGFAFEIDAEGEVRHINARAGECGMVLSGLTPEQLSLLQYVVGAYLSGEVVDAGDILAIAKRENFTGARALKSAEPAKPNRGLYVRNFAVLAAAWALGLSLVALVGFSVFSRNFVVNADGFLASDAALTVRAPAAGVVNIEARPGTKVGVDDVVATLDTADGRSLPITAGCDCVVAGLDTRDGTALAQTAKVAELIPAGARLSGEFLVPLATARRLRPGDPALVDFYASGTQARATVDNIVLPAFASTTGYDPLSRDELALHAVVRVKFDSPPSASLIGQPAGVRIRALRFAL